MVKSGKLSRQELSERKKRIPQRTQEILRKMIGRRRAELESMQGNGARKPLSWLPELLAELAPAINARRVPTDKTGD